MQLQQLRLQAVHQLQLQAASAASVTGNSAASVTSSFSSFGYRQVQQLQLQAASAGMTPTATRVASYMRLPGPFWCGAAGFSERREPAADPHTLVSMTIRPTCPAFLGVR